MAFKNDRLALEHEQAVRDLAKLFKNDCLALEGESTVHGQEQVKITSGPSSTRSR